MEKRLMNLFDYQAYEQHPGLARLIDETNARCSAELTDEDLSFVAAARGLPPTEDPKKI